VHFDRLPAAGIGKAGDERGRRGAIGEPSRAGNRPVHPVKPSNARQNSQDFRVATRRDGRRAAGGPPVAVPKPLEAQNP